MNMVFRLSQSTNNSHFETKSNKHKAELQRTDPPTKDMVEFSNRGRILPTECPKWIIIIPIVLVGGKDNACNHQSPSIGPIKIDQKC